MIQTTCSLKIHMLDANSHITTYFGDEPELKFALDIQPSNP